MSVTIWATHRFVGWHSWPEAPNKRAYLASPHRHLFLVRVEVNVLHDDREIEFHDLGDAVAEGCAPYVRAGARSCETMARELRLFLLELWPGRDFCVEVSEDGEFGAKVQGEDRAGV